MIPIRDPRGRVIAFGGRILGEGEPKYLNSPDTPLFDKGRTLYNIDRASPASRAAKRLIVVEGYMDVIALDRAGIAEVVAPNGTAVTEAQLERMWRLDPVADPLLRRRHAGRKAAIRAALRALPHLAPTAPCASSSCPQARTRTTWSLGRAGRLRGLLAKGEASTRGCGVMKSTPSRSPRLRPAPPSSSASLRTPRRSATPPSSHVPRGMAAALRRPPPPAIRRAGRTAAARRGSFKNGRFLQPDPPVGDKARAIASSGIDAPTARALILGFTNYPEELPAHCEQLAALPIADRGTAQMRDDLVNAAFSGAALDRAA